MTTIQVTGNEFDLIEWLRARENDVAMEIEDFGALRLVFCEVLEREPMSPQVAK